MELLRTPEEFFFVNCSLSRAVVVVVVDILHWIIIVVFECVFMHAHTRMTFLHIIQTVRVHSHVIEHIQGVTMLCSLYLYAIFQTVHTYTDTDTGAYTRMTQMKLAMMWFCCCTLSPSFQFVCLSVCLSLHRCYASVHLFCFFRFSVPFSVNSTYSLSRTHLFMFIYI